MLVRRARLKFVERVDRLMESARCPRPVAYRAVTLTPAGRVNPKKASAAVANWIGRIGEPRETNVGENRCHEAPTLTARFRYPYVAIHASPRSWDWWLVR